MPHGDLLLRSPHPPGPAHVRDHALSNPTAILPNKEEEEGKETVYFLASGFFPKSPVTFQSSASVGSDAPTYLLGHM